MLGYGVVAEALVAAKVDTIFGVMGDGNMSYLVEFCERNGRYVSAVDEGGATSMADGYARLHGFGVASVTHGPGAANTVNALIEAVRASSPLLLITASTPDRRGQNQSINLERLLAPTGAAFQRVLSADDIAHDVVAAVAMVEASRRPLVLDIPLDIQGRNTDIKPRRHQQVAVVPREPDADTLDAALGIIANARRPLVLAGKGAVEAGAGPALVELADLIGAPLATSASGRGLFRGHPYNLGLMGDCGVPWAVSEMSEADCIIAFGAGLNSHTTVDGGMLDGKAVVHCDSDPVALTRYARPDVAIAADARVTAENMVAILREADLPSSRFREQRLGAGVADRSPHDDFEDQSTSETLDARTALIALESLMPEDRVIVSDGGRFILPVWRYLHAASARDFIHTMSWQSIGLGTSMAIGAAAASPGRLTVGVVGDGGGMMGLIEMSTAVRHGLTFALVVINDGAYGVEHVKFQELGYDSAYSLYDWPDFADVARALGADAVTVRTMADLEEATAKLDGLTRPMLIDIRIDPAVNTMA